MSMMIMMVVVIWMTNESYLIANKHKDRTHRPGFSGGSVEDSSFNKP